MKCQLRLRQTSSMYWCLVFVLRVQCMCSACGSSKDIVAGACGGAATKKWPCVDSMSVCFGLVVAANTISIPYSKVLCLLPLTVPVLHLSRLNAWFKPKIHRLMATFDNDEAVHLGFGTVYPLFVPLLGYFFWARFSLAAICERLALQMTKWIGVEIFHILVVTITQIDYGLIHFVLLRLIQEKNWHVSTGILTACR